MTKTRQRHNPLGASKRHSQAHDDEAFSRPEHFAIGLSTDHSCSANRDSEGLGRRLEQSPKRSIPLYL